MKLPDVADLAPVQRPLADAHGDAGKSCTVANSALAWSNAQACNGCDLAGLWSVDDAIAQVMVATAALVARLEQYPTAFGLGPPFQDSGARWRPALSGAGSHD